MEFEFRFFRIRLPENVVEERSITALRNEKGLAQMTLNSDIFLIEFYIYMYSFHGNLIPLKIGQPHKHTTIKHNSSMMNERIFEQKSEFCKLTLGSNVPQTLLFKTRIIQ